MAALPLLYLNFQSRYSALLRAVLEQSQSEPSETTSSHWAQSRSRKHGMHLLTARHYRVQCIGQSSTLQYLTSARNAGDEAGLRSNDSSSTLDVHANKGWPGLFSIRQRSFQASGLRCSSKELSLDTLATGPSRHRRRSFSSHLASQQQTNPGCPDLEKTYPTRDLPSLRQGLGGPYSRY